MLADEYDMSFFETSAKENESIDEAFECIAREIMERFVPGWAIKERDKPTQEAVVEIKRKSRFSRTKECC